MITIRETGQVLPFGYAHKDWVSFKEEMRLGDSIYWFSHRKGRFYMDGHLLVRYGCVLRLLPGAIS